MICEEKTTAGKVPNIFSREEGNTPGQNNQAHTNVPVFLNATLNVDEKK